MNNSPMSRRRFLAATAAGAALLPATPLFAQGLRPDKSPPPRRTPVILATDIGDDIDDTWALGFLLRCPELDLKLAVTDYGKPDYRARLLAKFLQTVGRSDVPVGLGAGTPTGDGPQAEWIRGYDLKSYPGKVHPDGVQALIDIVLQSSEPVIILGIGPMPTLAAALEREPKIAQRARFVGMDGSIYVGYGGSKKPDPEWNVKADVKSAQKVFTAPWGMTITPLDTCGLVTLDGERYQSLRRSKDPVAATVLECYRVWNSHIEKPADFEHGSTTLFDAVAVYLAFSQEFCRMENLGIRVTDDGSTRVDESAKKIDAAIAWKNLDGFRDLLTRRLGGLRPAAE